MSSESADFGLGEKTAGGGPGVASKRTLTLAAGGGGICAAPVKEQTVSTQKMPCWKVSDNSVRDGEFYGGQVRFGSMLTTREFSA